MKRCSMIQLSAEKWGTLFLRNCSLKFQEGVRWAWGNADASTFSDVREGRWNPLGGTSGVHTPPQGVRRAAQATLCPFQVLVLCTWLQSFLPSLHTCWQRWTGPGSSCKGFSVTHQPSLWPPVPPLTLPAVLSGSLTPSFHGEKR